MRSDKRGKELHEVVRREALVKMGGEDLYSVKRGR
jgi:hypothetical protein